MPFIDTEKVNEKTRAKLEALIEKSYSSYWRKKRLFDIFFATLILLFFLHSFFIKYSDLIRRIINLHNIR